MEKLECLELQLSEVEMLQSMFPSELTLDDPLALSDIQDFIDGKIDYDNLNSRIGMSIKLKIGDDEEQLELVCHLPHEYPTVIPQVFVRCVCLSRNQYKLLNDELENFITEHELGEIFIGSVVQWIQDNSIVYVTASKEEMVANSVKSKDVESKGDNKFSRMWIYSHHIYSKIKRKDILDFSDELDLTGFSMPGKPGMICIEGYNNHVEEFWHRIRRMQWKRLVMREKEDFNIEDKSVDDLRKFDNFEEKSFEPRQSKGRGAHSDRGLLYQFLEQNGSAHIFQVFFGVEGKCVDDSE